MSRTKYTSMR